MSSRLTTSGSRNDRVVRGSVEETLNALPEAEADRLCNAQRYDRSEARRDTRAGHYERRLQTKAGDLRLKVPKLQAQTFETAIIERYRRRESSVEEALIEMYLAGCAGSRTSRKPYGARVVIGAPSFEQSAGVRKRAEQSLIEEFVAQAANEGLGERVLHRLARRDVMPGDRVIVRPSQDSVRGELGSTVADDHPGIAALGKKAIELAGNAGAGDRGVCHQRQALACVKSSTTARIRMRRPSMN